MRFYCFCLQVSKLQFKRGPALKFSVTQFKAFLLLQLARVRIQTALLLSCVWCAEALKCLLSCHHNIGSFLTVLRQ
jgi:hypothetical protein